MVMIFSKKNFALNIAPNLESSSLKKNWANQLVMFCSFAALASSQAISATGCPTGYAGKKWDNVKVGSMAATMGDFDSSSPNKVVMACLHRGFHDNPYDNANSKYKDITTGVPGNSLQAISQAFNWAPCVEVDVTGANDSRFTQAYQKAVISHDAVVSATVSYADAHLGNDLSLYQNNRVCTGKPSGATDKTLYSCSIQPVYDSNGNINAPTSHVNDQRYLNTTSGGATVSIAWLRTFTSQDRAATSYPLVDLAGLESWLYGCIKDSKVTDPNTRSNSNVGLIVLDAKNLAGLRAVDAMVDWINKNRADPVDEAIHLIVKTKPWKMISANAGGSLTEYENIVKDLANNNVGMIDTLTQAGEIDDDNELNESASDYNATLSYFNWKANFFETVVAAGTGSFQPIEVVVPGDASHDPLANGKTFTWFSGCTGSSGNERRVIGNTTLSNLVSEQNGINSSACSFPQIWGWVNLGDGYAKDLLDSSGKSVLNTSKYSYVKDSSGKYIFGIASSSATPVGQRIGYDDQETKANWVTNTVGARVMTLDSLAVFYSTFPGYLTDQSIFTAK